MYDYYSIHYIDQNAYTSQPLCAYYQYSELRQSFIWPI